MALVLSATPLCAWGHELEKPIPLQEPAPRWPDGIASTYDVVVPVILTISSEGKVTEVEVEASLGAKFDEAAVQAAMRWTFMPARNEGVPVAAKVRAVVRFFGEPASAPGKPALAGPLDTDNATSTAKTSAQTSPATQNFEPVIPLGHGEDEHHEVHIAGQRVSNRGASEVVQDRKVIEAAPHRTANDLLLVVPGMFITQHSGEGKAYQIFFRGFDAVHGQDLEIWAGGAPVNDVSNIHGQGYADLNFIPPEVVQTIISTPGTYDPHQGDFAVAGSIRMNLGYQEPGITAKSTVGQFNTRRYFLAYRPRSMSESTFAAFELYSTDGFGPSRAARRASALAQAEYPLGDSAIARVLATAHAARFDSAGVLRLTDVESGAVNRFATYDPHQGGDASRTQLVLEIRDNEEASRWSLLTYTILRTMSLKQDFTGYYQQAYSGAGANATATAAQEGNLEQQLNSPLTLGTTGSYLLPFPAFGEGGSVEAGFSARTDKIDQSQKRLAIADQRVTLDEVEARINATDVAGFIDTTLHPFTRVILRGGLRMDGLAYAVQDDAGQAQGQNRSAMGAHLGKKGTLDISLLPGLNFVANYGEGFRSPQARSLTNGQTAPFTTVVSCEAGLRFRNKQLRSSLAAFQTLLSDDLAFDQATARNERTPATRRTGLTAEVAAAPTSWFNSSTSFTYTRAEFRFSDTNYQAGDLLPYAPQIVARSDMALSPTIGHYWGRSLTAHVGSGLTYMGLRPLPFGQFGHDIFLVDATASVRLKEVQLGVDAFNLLNANWYDGEFVYASNFTQGASPSLIPQTHVSVGAPRTLLVTAALFL